MNRFCASGLQTIATAAERIMAGAADCIVAGGAESMSLVPMGGNKFSANPGLVAAWPESYAGDGHHRRAGGGALEGVARRTRTPSPPRATGAPRRRRTRAASPTSSSRWRSRRSRWWTASWSAATRRSTPTTASARDTTVEALAQAEAGVQGGRHRHRRQRLADDRRGRGGAGGLGGLPGAAPARAAGPVRRASRSRACRPSSWGSARWRPSRPRSKRAGLSQERGRPRRAERGLRGPVAGLRARRSGSTRPG